MRFDLFSRSVLLAMTVSGLAAFDPAAAADPVAPAVPGKNVVWDGDQLKTGQGWVSPQTSSNYFRRQPSDTATNQTVLELHAEGALYIGGGWNWRGWWPPTTGTDVTTNRNLAFWMKVSGSSKPDLLQVCLASAGATNTSRHVDLAAYAEDVADGQWHEVVIPLQDLADPAADFKLAKTWELQLHTWSPTPREFSLLIREIAFDNRPVRSHVAWVTLPEKRAPQPLGTNVVAVTAEVDIQAAGTPISPFIYGAAGGDRKAAVEMGLTALRAGGNPVTPENWQHGYSSKGADWYFENYGTETPPEKNWLANFHGENKKFNLETYLTIPLMGRVAKDGTSVAFDIHKYPGQESWVGKVQPADPRGNAGNGRQLQADKDGKYVGVDIAPNPDDTSVVMTPADQTELLRFIIEKLGAGSATNGGVKFVALDNEPGLWHITHRGMHPKGCSYDELWERTRTYATLLKKIDPSVKLAGPTAWGWSDYFYSGLDSQRIDAGHGTWDDPPDYAAHDRVPLTCWYLRQLRAYEKQTGQRLVDILDFHFYPQNGLYQAGKPNDPAVMESRVQETRALWDPTWQDPSWMGKETGHVIQLIRLMKRWIAENNPGLQTALGEYCFSGESDISGGVAEAETLGVFAREGLDHAYYWFCPVPNSSPYFGFKMFRNPDGQHTVFGDRYLPSNVSAPTDVSVHAARDTATGRLTFILVNKRAATGARVTVKLNAALPAQAVTLYEYSRADRFAIGELPTQQIAGRTITVDLPPLSVVRFDAQPGQQH